MSDALFTGPAPLAEGASSEEEDLSVVSALRRLEVQVNSAVDAIEVKTRLLEMSCMSGLRFRISKHKTSAQVVPLQQKAWR